MRTNLVLCGVTLADISNSVRFTTYTKAIFVFIISKAKIEEIVIIIGMNESQAE